MEEAKERRKNTIYVRGKKITFEQLILLLAGHKHHEKKSERKITEG